MKNTCMALCLCLCHLGLIAQTDSLKTVSLEASLVVGSLDAVRGKLETIFEANDIVPEYLTETTTLISTKFHLDDKAFQAFEKEYVKWGYVTSKKMQSVDYGLKLKRAEEEIKAVRADIASYERLLSELSPSDSNHPTYWNRLEARKSTLEALLKSMRDYRALDGKFEVKLQVTEESMTTPQRSSFSFANMPGVQYGLLVVENPIAGEFPSTMHGVSIKYLLNRHQTFVRLGLFKSLGSERYDDLYKIGVGQGFYSTRLGGGKRRFFNLYSGVETGGFILTGEEDRFGSWFVTPSIGVELFKTKYLLVDNKASYFLPIQENRNLRGFLYEVSVNVLF